MKIIIQIMLSKIIKYRSIIIKRKSHKLLINQLLLKLKSKGFKKKSNQYRFIREIMKILKGNMMGLEGNMKILKGNMIIRKGNMKG